MECYRDRILTKREKEQNPNMGDKFALIYNNDSTFRQEIIKQFKRNVYSNEVKIIANKIFNHASSDIHQFNTAKGVTIRDKHYDGNAVKFLQALCNSIDCYFTVEP
jgi:hypothetical protein